MKLAEALQERSSLKKSISGLRERLEKAAQGTEDPMKLLKDLDQSLNRMEYLVAAINHTNDLVRADGKTMTELIAGRDTLFFRLELYKNLIRQTGDSGNRNPVRVNMSELQSRVDGMLQEIRSLDNLIQKTNWTKELIE